MKQKNREIVAFILTGILILGLILLMFALALVGYNNSTVDLSKVASCKGYVIDNGVILKKGKMDQNVFSFRISGINERFASYNKEQDYSKLTATIKNGDILKVYYKKTENPDLNLNVI